MSLDWVAKQIEAINVTAARPPLRYVADFVWEEGGKTVVADVKGVAVDVYKVKRHLMKAVHGIDILEIRA